MLVLGISGSLRSGSYNRALLRAAARELPSDVDFEEWGGLGRIPPYDADRDAEPGAEAVVDLREALTRADAVLIATPEYNHSVPGQLKNALDWASRPLPDNSLRDKPIAVIGASTSVFGAVWAQAEVRKVLAASGAAVVDEELAVARAQDAFRSNGSLHDAGLRTALSAIMGELLVAARVPVGQAA